MAKKIRFPLTMAEDHQVRTLEELREYFSLPEVLGYVADGKLITWLNDRYEHGIAQTIQSLDSNESDYTQKICETLGVEYQQTSLTLEDAHERNERLSRLREITDNKRYLDNVDAVAFDQDELYDRLDEDKTTLYLCGDKFTIPLGKEGITYIGINTPVVVIDAKEVVDFEKKTLHFEDVAFDTQYQALLDAVSPIKPTKAKSIDIPSTSQGTIGQYQSNSYIRFLLTAKQQKEAETSFVGIVDSINEISYDPTADSANMRQILMREEIIGMGETFLQNL